MELECRGVGILVCFRAVCQRIFVALARFACGNRDRFASLFSRIFGSARTAYGLAMRGRWIGYGRTRLCRYDVFAAGAASVLPARGNSQRTRRVPPH